MSSSPDAVGPTLTRLHAGIPYIVVVGQLLLIGVVTPGVDGQPPIVGAVIGEGLLAGLLGVTLAQTQQRAAGLISFLVAGLVLTGGSLFVAGMTAALWPVAAVLVGSLASTAYVFHRIELVRLGLVGGDRQ